MRPHLLQPAVERHQRRRLRLADRAADAAEAVVRAAWAEVLRAIEAGGPWFAIYARLASALQQLGPDLARGIAANLADAGLVAHADAASAAAEQLPPPAPVLEARRPPKSPAVLPANITVISGTLASLAAAAEWLQGGEDPGVLAAAANVPSGGTVRLELDEDTGRLWVYGQADGLRTTRWFSRERGKTIAHNARIEIDPSSPHKGQGHALFTAQVEVLQAAGVDEIHASAEGAPGTDLNGYYTWPRLGYEGTIAPEQFQRLPASIQAKMGSSRSIRKLFDDVPGGPAAWKLYGSTIADARFDLTPGSQSLKALDRYARERAAAQSEPSASPALDAGMIFDAPDPGTLHRIVYASDWPRRIAAQTRLADPATIATLITQGLAAGRTPAQIARDVRPLVQGVQTSARRVARTECMRVAGEVQLQAWDELGDMVVGYQVHATLDQNTRPEHRDRDGTTYWKEPKPGQKGLDEMPRPPLESARDSYKVAFNCRCFLAPVLRENL